MKKAASLSLVTLLMAAIASFMLYFPSTDHAQSVSYSYQVVNRLVGVTGNYCGASASCNISGSGAAFHQLVWTTSGTVSACTITVDSSADNSAWSTGGVITSQTCTSSAGGPVTSSSIVPNFVRMTVTMTGTGTITPILTGFLNNPIVASGSVTSLTATAPVVATPSPITTTGAFSCPTCTTNAAALTSGNFTQGSGGNAIADSTKAVPTGVVVGTTDTQSLTNKTFNSNVNLGSTGTFSGQLTFNGTTSGTNQCTVAASGGTVTCTQAIQSNNLISTGPVKYATLTTQTNCSASGTAANPSVVSCSAAPTGAFACATNASGGTCQVNTTAATTNSNIQITQTASAGTRLSVTCNTTADTPTGPRLASISNGASFTINLGTVASNPTCYFYSITN